MTTKSKFDANTTTPPTKDAGTQANTRPSSLHHHAPGTSRASALSESHVNYPLDGTFQEDSAARDDRDFAARTRDEHVSRRPPPRLSSIEEVAGERWGLGEWMEDGDEKPDENDNIAFVDGSSAGASRHSPPAVSSTAGRYPNLAPSSYEDQLPTSGMNDEELAFYFERVGILQASLHHEDEAAVADSRPADHLSRRGVLLTPILSPWERRNAVSGPSTGISHHARTELATTSDEGANNDLASHPSSADDRSWKHDLLQYAFPQKPAEDITVAAADQELARESPQISPLTSDPHLSGPASDDGKTSPLTSSEADGSSVDSDDCHSSESSPPATEQAWASALRSDSVTIVPCRTLGDAEYGFDAEAHERVKDGIEGTELRDDADAEASGSNHDSDASSDSSSRSSDEQLSLASDSQLNDERNKDNAPADVQYSEPSTPSHDDFPPHRDDECDNRREDAILTNVSSTGLSETDNYEGITCPLHKDELEQGLEIEMCTVCQDNIPKDEKS